MGGAVGIDEWQAVAALLEDHQFGRDLRRLQRGEHDEAVGRLHRRIVGSMGDERGRHVRRQVALGGEAVDLLLGRAGAEQLLA